MKQVRLCPVALVITQDEGRALTPGHFGFHPDPDAREDLRLRMQIEVKATLREHGGEAIVIVYNGQPQVYIL